MRTLNKILLIFFSITSFFIPNGNVGWGVIIFNHAFCLGMLWMMYNYFQGEITKMEEKNKEIERLKTEQEELKRLIREQDES